MALKNYFIFVLISIIFSACNIGPKFTGTYSNEVGDSLTVRKNKTYKLSETINSRIRKTKGKWQYYGNTDLVRFINIPQYLVENFHTISAEKSNKQLSEIRVFFADTDSIISIPSAYGFLKNDTIPLMGLHQSYVKTLYFEENLDSIYLNMWKYKNVIINIPDTLKHIYTLRFYPTEPAYDFDRIYNNIDNKLFPTDTTNTNKRLRFKKTK